MDEETKQDTLPPHRTLTDYYDSDPERSQYVFDLFNRTAHHYNTIERIFGNGGLLYRRLSLRFNGLRPGMRVLDVATGTGNVLRGAVKDSAADWFDPCWQNPGAISRGHPTCCFSRV